VTENARYHFVTNFTVTADREQVWETLQDPRDWPSWWRWLKRVDVLDEGGPDKVGARFRYGFGTALPYTMSFELRLTRVEGPAALEAVASGDLSGSGLWELRPAAQGGAAVTYTWLVETTKRWMNVIAPVARPAFSWNHDVLMRDFAKGVATITSSQLLSVSNTTVKPGSPGFYRLPDTVAEAP
jgi:uncharacterized protein YndB with AHSA1/START domain